MIGDESAVLKGRTGILGLPLSHLPRGRAELLAALRYHFSMHRHLSEVFQTLDASRSALRDAFKAIPEPQRRLRPAADRWSAVDIVEHLSLVERRFTHMLDARVSAALDQGLAPETAERVPLPTPVAERMQDRLNRRTAPDPAQPTGQLDEVAAWGAAEAARQAFRDTVTRGDGLALSTVSHAHPFFGELNIYQWVELIAGHEQRHVQQLRELASALAGR